MLLASSKQNRAKTAGLTSLFPPHPEECVYIPQPQTQLAGPGLGDHLLSSVYLTPGEQTKQDVHGFVSNSLFGFETPRRGDS